jgi:hypothetical protein
MITVEAASTAAPLKKLCFDFVDNYMLPFAGYFCDDRFIRIYPFIIFSGRFVQHIFNEMEKGTSRTALRIGAMVKKQKRIPFLLLLAVSFLAASCKAPENGAENTGLREAGLTQSPHMTFSESSESDRPVIAAFEPVSDPFSTKDLQTTAQIVRYEGEEGYTIRLTSEDRLLADLPFEGNAQILSVEWLNEDSLLTITTHVNPSANQYCVVALSDSYQTSYYAGCVFVWNTDWSNLYYISPAPHFSESCTDTLTDKTGRIYYQTSDGCRLTPTLAVSPDEAHFAVILRTPEDEVKLLILENTEDAQAQAVCILSEFTGAPSFSDNDTLVLTADTGESTALKLGALYP